MAKALVIAASYNPGNVDVELFCRGEDGKSYTLLVAAQRPYFFVELKPESEAYIKSRLSNDPAVETFEETQLKDAAGTTKYLKVFIDKPFDTPKYRADFEAMGLQVMACDIPFALRVMIDLDIGAFISFTGTQLAGYGDRYKTDEVWQVEKIDNVPSFEISLKMLAFDCENRLGSDELFCISTFDGTKDITFEGKDAWLKFQAFVLAKDPDILIGHNIVEYDLPLLDRNAGADGLQIGRKWGRMQKRPKEAMMIPGRIVADSLVWARRTWSLERYALGFIAPKILGKEKMNVAYNEMDKLWKEDKAKIIAYCENDTRLSYELYEATGHIKRATMLSLASRLPLQEVFYNKNGIILDRLAIPEFDKGGWAVPPNRRAAEVDIAGAYVHEPEPGLYDTVVVMDVSSMYPSAILEYNICPTTLIPSGTVPIEKYHEVPLTDAKGNSTGQSSRFKTGESILPNVIRMLKDQRTQAKESLKKATSERDKLIWENYQWGLKIIANAFYGLLASGFYRFTSPAIGNAITSAARATTLHIIKDLSEKGYNVVLSDTDSIGVELKGVSVEQAVATGMELVGKYSHGEIQLNLEKVLQPFFTHAKKRYFGQIVWPENKRLERGYEVRRTDKFPLLNETQSKVMDLVLAGKSKEAVNIALEAISAIRKSSVNLESLVISKSVDSEEAYVNPDAMIGVKMARKLKEAKIPVIVGQKISWIITDNSDGLQGVPLELYAKEKPCEDYYVVALAKAIGRILEVYGWDEEGLKRGMRQATLF